MTIDFTKEDADELVQRASAYKSFLEDEIFSSTSKKELLDSLLYVVLLLRGEIKNLQQELDNLKNQRTV